MEDDEEGGGEGSDLIGDGWRFSVERDWFLGEICGGRDRERDVKRLVCVMGMLSSSETDDSVPLEEGGFVVRGLPRL